MRPIHEYQEVRTGLYYWSGYDAAVKADLSCCAVAAPSGLVFVDPLPLAEEPLGELMARLRPVAIVLTNANHERASARYAARFGVPVHAHDAVRGEVQADSWLADGNVIAGALEVIHLPGFGRGEIALYGGNILMIGDALINLEPHGFALLPGKYCEDPALGKESLRKLLHLRVELMHSRTARQSCRTRAGVLKL